MDRLVERESARQFTYEPGLTRGPRPRRWFVDDVSAIVGVGRDAFDAARDALASWEHLDLGWFRVHRSEAITVEPGSVVALSARVLGLWWSACCRIVEIIDETDADGSRRFGFAYGTVGAHPERGEERFLVTLDAAGREVTGSIVAVSRPARWFTVLGLPVARRAQARFKPDALAALAGAVRRRLGAGSGT